MKTLCILAFIVITALSPAVNKPVEKVDLNRYAGKWYSLYSIPTMFDKGTREPSLPTP